MGYRVYLTTPVNTYSFKRTGRPDMMDTLKAIVDELPHTKDLDRMVSLITLKGVPLYTDKLVYAPGFSISLERRF